MAGKRLENLQTPLGELLFKARQEKAMTRSELAEITGISENSLVRYEKAGLEKDGQYPPSPKLAALCFALGIPPMKALYSCLDNDGFFKYKQMVWEEELMGHPDHEYLIAQHTALIKSNEKLSTVLRLLLDEDAANEMDLDEATVDHLIGQARDLVLAQKQFGDYLEARWGGRFAAFSLFSYPGVIRVKATGEYESDWAPDDFRSYPREDKSGPTQEGSDRPETSKNNPDDVPASATRKRKDPD